MKKVFKKLFHYQYILIILILIGYHGCTADSEDRLADAPKTKIANKFINATLYLPDSAQGYYRGTRFDWSGIIASLEYEGHTYFGKWFKEYDPTDHDAVLGPAEVFTPLGYCEAKPGGYFIKIGVGVLKRKNKEKYNPFTYYKVANHGKWTVETYKNRVMFSQKLNGSNYSYNYHKTIKLIEGEPQLVIEHSLKNIGKRSIETSMFNHNFFVIDKEPTGPGIHIIFPFEVHAKGNGFGSIAKTVGKEIKYSRQLAKNEHVYSKGLQGIGSTADNYDIKIENRKTGAGVRIIGDRPLEKLVFWASSTTSCPEPYIQLQIQPGQKVQWKIIYKFYTKDDSN